MFLGLDVGGTHCRWEWSPHGVAPGGATAGAQPAVHGLDVAAANLAGALAAATRGHEPAAAVAALAGVGDVRTAASFVDALRRRGVALPLAVVGDVLAAAAAALADGPGVLVWSGTGSFAVARAANGELHRVGGRGHLLGDQGSGYDLVRRAAAAALLAVDGLGPATALTEALTAAFGAPAPTRLGAVLQQLDTAQVAARLPTVLAIAAQGDAVADDVVASGVDRLVMLATAALRHAGLDWRDAPLSGGGGVLLGAPAVSDLLSRRFAALGAGPLQLLDDRAAARGAARLARDWHEHRQPAHGWVEHVAL